MNFNPLKTNTNPTYTNNQVAQRSNTLGYSYKNKLMPHMEITALCSEKHTEHVGNTLCGQIVEILMLNLVVHVAITGL
jgi:hypothetical protein